MVESASDEILAGAQDVDVAFLVVGDPFGYAPSFRHIEKHLLMDIKSHYTHRLSFTRARA